MTAPSLLARVSLWSPWVLLGLLGVLRHAGVQDGAAPAALAIAAVLGALVPAGVALGARLPGRREALLGLFSGLLLLTIAGLGRLTGWRDAQERSAQADHLRQRALHESGGWFGRAQGQGFAVIVTEVDPRSDAASGLLANFPERFQILLVAVDNRAGQAPLRVDLAAARVVRADATGGTGTPVLDRAALLQQARASREELTAQHGAPYQVPPGGRLGSALLFVAAGEDLGKVVAIDVPINGQPVRVPGRVLSADEKRALRRPGPRR